MKKTYIHPTTQLGGLCAAGMIAASDVISKGTPIGDETVDADSRSNNSFWDEEQ